MASGRKRGGGDRILESRHLVGLFLGIVLLCGVFFTLGYVMGRTQYGGAVHAETLPHTAEPASMTEPAAGAPPVASVPAQDWDFSDKKKDVASGSVVLAPKPVSEATDDSGISSQPMTPTPAVTLPAALPMQTPVAKARVTASTPKTAKAPIVLQVAALTHQSDAVWMASVLQKKHFHAFIVGPVRGDSLYHVQVGPYADERAAETARTALDHDGFKVIIKR